MNNRVDIKSEGDSEHLYIRPYVNGEYLPHCNSIITDDESNITKVTITYDLRHSNVWWRLNWYNFRTKLRYNIVSKGIEKWARHKVRPKGTEYNQRQEQMRSVFCGINAFMI